MATAISRRLIGPQPFLTEGPDDVANANGNGLLSLDLGVQPAATSQPTQDNSGVILSPPNVGGDANMLPAGWNGGTDTQPGPTGPPTSELGPPVPDVNPAVTGDPSQAQQPPDFRAQVRAKVLDLLNAPPETADSLYNSPEAEAQRIASQREGERLQSETVERAAANGTGAGLEGVLRGQDFSRAESNAKFVGDLATQRAQMRQQAILTALGLGGNLSQGDDQLGLNYADLAARLNQQAVLAALSGAA